MKKTKLIKRFLPYYRPHIKVFTLDLLCAFGVAICELVFPMLVRYLLNEALGTTAVAWQPVIIVAALMLGTKLAQMLCNYYMTTVGHVMGSRLEASMRHDLYTKLLALPQSFYDNRQVGDLMSRVNNDLFEITEFSHHCPEEIFLGIVRLLGAFIYLAFINIYLTLILFALLPPLVLFAIINNRKMRTTFREQRKKVSEINSQLEDSLSGISVIRSFGNEDIETAKFEKNNDEFVEVKKKSYKIMGVFHSGTMFSSGLMYVATVIFGVLFIRRGTLTTVDLVAFLLYVSTLLSAISVIMTYTEQFQRGMSGIARFVEIMDEPITITSPAQPKENIDFTQGIELRNVKFSYDDSKTVLDNISFTVAKGESLALVGPSGAGKTTIANIIPRFYELNDGDILIDGTSIKDMSLKTLRDNVGVVQQTVYLFYGTVKENILYGNPAASDEEVIAAAKKAGAHEFITKLANGYDTVCGERGVKLSGGQKQRISIARLFLKNPPILLLDEATSALDNESERLVQQSLDELAKGRTTITIAHRLTTIKNADRILVLTDDGIAEEGNHKQLVAKGGLYSQMYAMYNEER